MSGLPSARIVHDGNHRTPLITSTKLASHVVEFHFVCVVFAELRAYVGRDRDVLQISIGVVFDQQSVLHPVSLGSYTGLKSKLQKCSGEKPSPLKREALELAKPADFTQ